MYINVYVYIYTFKVIKSLCLSSTTFLIFQYMFTLALKEISLVSFCFFQLGCLIVHATYIQGDIWMV